MPEPLSSVVGVTSSVVLDELALDRVARVHPDEDRAVLQIDLVVGLATVDRGEAPPCGLGLGELVAARFQAVERLRLTHGEIERGARP